MEMMIVTNSLEQSSSAVPSAMGQVRQVLVPVVVEAVLDRYEDRESARS